jgi:serine/threonine-protein kinase
MGQRALTLAPTDEVEIRRFIEALARAGDRAAAVGFYEKFAEKLGQELELRPDAESRGLVERIRASLAPDPVSSAKPEAPALEAHVEAFRRAIADRYRIEREIGRGGMATVYLAHDIRHERRVAVKVLNPELGRSLGAQRFLREIKTAANLAHPHILPLFDSGEADGLLFYVMPYVKGESLRARLTRESQLPIEDAVRITREIADALAYAHEEGIVHRDVKPANIMLEAGHAVLADFGVAQAVAEAKDDRITRTGSSLGTPAYMSPEQAAGARKLDGRTDQYALGCVLYEMLAGHPPFTGTQLESVMRRHITDDPPPVTQERPSVPEDVAKVIHRALAKSPADRFRTTGEMAAALIVMPAPHRTRPRPFRRLSGTTVGLLGVAVIAAVGVLILWLGWGPAPPGSVAVLQDAKPSIVVLPFENLSDRAEDAVFTNGLRGEIITQLYKVGGLGTSALENRDSLKGPREIGEALGVRYVMEGDVLRSGNTVRVHVRVYDATTAKSVWADTYDRPLSNESLLTVLTEVVNSVTHSVRAAVTAQELARIEEWPTLHPDAFEPYLEGLGRLRVANMIVGEEAKQGYMEAVGSFREAVSLDPGFGLAYARLALAHLSIWGLDQEEARVELAREALDQAVRLAPDLGETYHVLGWFRYWVDKDYEGALIAWEAAHQRLPGDMEPIGPYESMAYVMRRQGRYLDAVEILEDVFTQNPRRAALAAEIARTYMCVRRNEEAATWAERAIELGLGPDAFWTAALAYLKQEKITEARALLERATDSTAVTIIEAGFWVETYGRDFDAAAAWLRRADGPTLLTVRTDVAVWWGLLFQEMGDLDRAREAFREAVTAEVAGGRGGARLPIALAGAGEREAALAQADSIMNVRRTSQDLYAGHGASEGTATVYVLLGEKETAIDQLEELMGKEQFEALTVADLRLDPAWDPLRHHPRFQALLAEHDPGG